MRPPPKSEKHHWWPCCLSEFWKDEKGKTWQLQPNGRLIPQSNPKSFGAIGNAHHVKMGNEPNPWHSSFEKDFDAADSIFPNIVRWLESLEEPPSENSLHLNARLEKHDTDPVILSQLSECLASLITRSPSFRYRIAKRVECFQARFGAVDAKLDESLLSANIQHCYKDFCLSMKMGGTFFVLRTCKAEFIFGDGFLHNFHSRDAPQAPLCLIPITPTISVMFAADPLHTRVRNLYTANLLSDEVELLNTIVQTYSAQFIFFRSVQPELQSEFKRQQHLSFPDDFHPFLASLLSLTR